MELCAPCHSRRFLLQDYRHEPGTDLLDHLVPSLLAEDLYFPDGQIQDEVYEYGSFVQSKMYRHNVRCTDCHDPHRTKRLKDGNALCLQCHRGDVYNTGDHHFHKEAHQGKPSAGWLCTSCHMPRRVYMGVDWRLDHSLRIPRPDLSLTLGTPNACSQSGCHADKPVKWAADAFTRWYGQARRPHYGTILAGARPNALDPSHRHGTFEDLDRLATLDEPQVAAQLVLELGNAHLCHKARIAISYVPVKPYSRFGCRSSPSPSEPSGMDPPATPAACAVSSFTWLATTSATPKEISTRPLTRNGPMPRTSSSAQPAYTSGKKLASKRPTSAEGDEAHRLVIHGRGAFRRHLPTEQVDLLALAVAEPGARNHGAQPPHPGKRLSEEREWVTFCMLRELKRYVVGWMNYFGISQLYRVLPELDQWLRRRVRMYYWKQWKRARQRRRQLIRLGIHPAEVYKATRSQRGYWFMAGTSIVQRALDNRWLAERGVPSLKEQWVKMHYGPTGEPQGSTAVNLTGTA